MSSIFYCRWIPENVLCEKWTNNGICLKTSARWFLSHFCVIFHLIRMPFVRAVFIHPKKRPNRRLKRHIKPNQRILRKHFRNLQNTQTLTHKQKEWKNDQTFIPIRNFSHVTSILLTRTCNSPNQKKKEKTHTHNRLHIYTSRQKESELKDVKRIKAQRKMATTTTKFTWRYLQNDFLGKCQLWIHKCVRKMKMAIKRSILSHSTKNFPFNCERARYC